MVTFGLCLGICGLYCMWHEFQVWRDGDKGSLSLRNSDITAGCAVMKPWVHFSSVKDRLGS